MLVCAAVNESIAFESLQKAPVDSHNAVDF
jgi:hypothetical protein